MLMKALGSRDQLKKTIENEKKRLRSEEEQRPVEEEQENTMESEDEILDRHLREEEGVIRDATEIGIEIVTAESFYKGLDPQEFNNMMAEGRVKYRMTENCRYEQKEVEDMIARELIYVTSNNPVKVSTNIFLKYKTARDIIQERGKKENNNQLRQNER